MWRPSPGFSCLWRDYGKKKIRLKNKGKTECLCGRNIEIWIAETNTHRWRNNDHISSMLKLWNKMSSSMLSIMLKRQTWCNGREREYVQATGSSTCKSGRSHDHLDLHIDLQKKCIHTLAKKILYAKLINLLRSP